MASPPPKPVGADRLRQLAGAGAERAGDALSRFAGRTLRPGEPRSDAPDSAAERAGWATGIFFQLEGDLRGEVALLLSRRLREGVTGAVSPEVRERESDSVLLELANIVASQAVSAIADALGGRILLSIPSFVGRQAARELAWRTKRLRSLPSALRIDVEFTDRGGALRALLVLMVDAGDDADSR